MLAAVSGISGKLNILARFSSQRLELATGTALKAVVFSPFLKGVA
jgi:hypothetical protein